MTTTFQFIHTNTNQGAKDLIEEKLQKLAAKFDWIIRANVVFKEDNGDKNKNSICEIELSVPGPRIFAKAADHNFEAAGVEAVNEILKQLKKRKDMMQQH